MFLWNPLPGRLGTGRSDAIVLAGTAGAVSGVRGSRQSATVHCGHLTRKKPARPPTVVHEIRTRREEIKYTTVENARDEFTQTKKK